MKQDSNLPEALRHVPPPETKATLDYADLAIIDLSKATTPDGRKELAKRVRSAMTEHGFFYVVGHEYEQEKASRMFDIADVAFAQVSDEEKQEYAGTMKQSGSYQGYKLRNYWHIEGGVRDQLEHYNINRDVTKRSHPVALRPFLPEIKDFAKFNHFKVLHEVLRLLALGLDLPEDSLVDIHGYDAVGETYVRFMKYYPRSDDEEAKTNNVWLKGHTDFGSVTILWSQPVAALQILARDGSWKWVKHIPNALVRYPFEFSRDESDEAQYCLAHDHPQFQIINAGDALSFLTAGVYPATIHRVVQPPPDQRQYTRLGVFYFCMPDDHILLTPMLGSQVVAKRVQENSPMGDEGTVQGGGTPTMEMWRKGRTAAYGQSELRKSDGHSNVEEEVINGVVVKHYN